MKGWNIDIGKLSGPSWISRLVNGHCEDGGVLYPNPTGDCGALLYNLTEVRMGMGGYVGFFALFCDRAHPVCVLNPKRFLCWETKVTWLTDRLLALRKCFGMRKDAPFAIIDVEGQRFSFIPSYVFIGYSIRLENLTLILTADEMFEGYPLHAAYPLARLPWYPNAELSSFGKYYSAEARSIMEISAVDMEGRTTLPREVGHQATDTLPRRPEDKIEAGSLPRTSVPKSHHHEER